MSDIAIKLFLFIMLVFFSSIAFFIKVNLDKHMRYHWLDFVWIDNNFKIKEWVPDFFTTNVIYVKKIPHSCKIYKNSIKCLSDLKKIWWTYNYLQFFSWTNLYK